MTRLVRSDWVERALKLIIGEESPDSPIEINADEGERICSGVLSEWRVSRAVVRGGPSSVANRGRQMNRRGDRQGRGVCMGCRDT